MLNHCQIFTEESMEDIKLVCADCGKEFVWTAGEQEYYKAHGLEHQPKRCAECRKAKKARVRDNFAQKEAKTETAPAEEPAKKTDTTENA